MGIINPQWLRNSCNCGLNSKSYYLFPLLLQNAKNMMMSWQLHYLKIYIQCIPCIFSSLFLNLHAHHSYYTTKRVKVIITMIIPHISIDYPSFSKLNRNNNCLLPINVNFFLYIETKKKLQFSPLIRNKFLFHTSCSYRVLNVFNYYTHFS